MRNIFTTSIVFLSCLVVYGQDAGITNPAVGLTIHRYNQSTNIDSNGDLNVDGWSNTGNVSSIKLYNNNNFQGNVPNPNVGTWYDNIDIEAGTNNIYANVRCNYSGCSMSGVNTSLRSITYVKPLDASDFYLTTDNIAGTIKITWFKHTQPGTSGFHYRVYRNTIDQVNGGSDWIVLGSWTQGSSYTDTSPSAGVTYYYWVVCATNNAGTYPSAYGSSRNTSLAATSSINLNFVSNSVNCFVNGTRVSIQGDVINTGSTTINSTEVSFYLSSDQSINTSDYFIGSKNTLSLPSNLSSNVFLNKNVSGISPQIPIGTYYIGMIVDPQNQITEYNESDNSVVSNCTVTISSLNNPTHSYYGNQGVLFFQFYTSSYTCLFKGKNSTLRYGFINGNQFCSTIDGGNWELALFKGNVKVRVLPICNCGVSSCSGGNNVSWIPDSNLETGNDYSFKFTYNKRPNSPYSSDRKTYSLQTHQFAIYDEVYTMNGVWVCKCEEFNGIGEMQIRSINEAKK